MTAMDLYVPDITDDMDVLTAALAYADARWYVLPTDPAIDIKHPGTVVGKDWQAKSIRDPKQITAWFAATNYGIALHCGRSGAVVFDVDHPDKLPEILCKHLQYAPFQSTRPDTPGRTIGNSGGRLGGSRLSPTARQGARRGCGPRVKRRGGAGS
jgi:hypothetical protein